MKNRFLSFGSIAAGYMGASIATFTDVDYLNWDFYVITIPVIILYNLEIEWNK